MCGGCRHAQRQRRAQWRDENIAGVWLRKQAVGQGNAEAGRSVGQVHRHRPHGRERLGLAARGHQDNGQECCRYAPAPAHDSYYVELSAEVTLALYVRELFGHLAVADLEQIDAPHMARSPVEPPPDRRPIARDDNLLRFETGIGGIVEESVPERAHCLLADHPLAVWRRQGVLENAVVGHQRHDGVDVVPAERLVEGIDGLGGAAHPWQIILAITSARFGPPLPNGTECTRCANTNSGTAATSVPLTCAGLCAAAICSAART